MNEKLIILKDQIKESFGSVFWTYTIHHKDAEILSNINNYSKILQIILSAVTTSGIIGIIISDSIKLKVITAIFGITQTLLTTYLKSFAPEKKSLLHKNVADKLWIIREKYKSLLIDIEIEEKSIKEIQKSRDMLAEKTAEIYRNAPKTTKQGFNKASKDIKKGIFSFSKEELNNLIETSAN